MAIPDYYIKCELKDFSKKNNLYFDIYALWGIHVHSYKCVIY
jgi:hypothetical protein